MSYATIAQLKGAITQRDLQLLTDFEGAGVASDARITEALEDASAEIDSYIAKVVALPLATPPRILSVMARDLAMHRLYVNLGHDMATFGKLRTDAINTLKSIARGETAIGGGSETPTEVTSPGVAMTDGPERRLTRKSLKGF